jgi:CheY-like chemotaxis protein
MNISAEARILVASESRGDADQLVRLLRDHFENVRALADRDLAIRDIAIRDLGFWPPHVVVLAFRRIEAAQSYSLELYRYATTAQLPPHRTILLCDRSEVGQAFDLCKRKCFDDYVLYWHSVQDGLRLPMSVWIAARETLARQAETMPQVALEELELAPPDMSASLMQADRAARSGPALVGDARRVRPMLLVIDDDELIHEILVRSPVTQDYELLFAKNHTEALLKLANARPDAILMDFRLPGVDGVALTRQLRHLPGLADIPVIMMTGDSRRATLFDSVSAGVQDFIVKPFTRELLAAKLDKALGRSIPQ